jgi:hypothetical protein
MAAGESGETGDSLASCREKGFLVWLRDIGEARILALNQRKEGLSIPRSIASGVRECEAVRLGWRERAVSCSSSPSSFIGMMSRRPRP